MNGVLFFLIILVSAFVFVLGCRWLTMGRFVARAEKILKENPGCKTLKSLVQDVKNDCDEVNNLKKWLRSYKEYTKTENEEIKEDLRQKLGLAT